MAAYWAHNPEVSQGFESLLRNKPVFGAMSEWSKVNGVSPDVGLNPTCFATGNSVTSLAQ